MKNFKTGDLVLCREPRCTRTPWVALTYVGIGQDGRVYFANGKAAPPDGLETVLLTEETIKYLGSCDDIPKPWEPKFGELVAAKKRYADGWKAVLFMKKDSDGKFVCRNGDSIPDSGGEELYDFCQPLYKHFLFSKTPEKNEGE